MLRRRPHPGQPAALTIARLPAVEIAVHWRWLPIVALGSTLLAGSVLPVRFPAWEPGTRWLVGAGAVLFGEAALLLHELAHAHLAQRRGQRVQRIVFHGFAAQTVVGTTGGESEDAVVALAGPAINLGLALLLEALRRGLAQDGPMDVLLLLSVLGNLAMGLMSLVPIGPSDGARALRALRGGVASVAGLNVQVPGQRQDQHDQNQQAEWRPAVVAPAPREAEATEEQGQ